MDSPLTSHRHDSDPRRDGDTSVHRILEIFRARRKLVRSFAIAGALFATIHFFAVRNYGANVLLVVQNSENNPIQAMLSKFNAPGSGASPFGTKSTDLKEKYILLMKSHQFTVRIAKSLRENPKYASLLAEFDFSPGARRRSFKSLVYDLVDSKIAGETENEALAELLSKGVRINKSGTDQINIRYSHRDPEKAVALANAYAEAAIHLVANNDLKDMSAAKKYIEDQLETISGRLNQFDATVVEFKRKNGILSSESQKAEVGSRIATMEKDMAAAEIQYKQNEKLIEILASELDKAEKELFASGARAVSGLNVIATLRQNIELLRKKKSLFEAQGYAANAREIQELNMELDETAARLQFLLEANGDSGTAIAAFGDDKESVLKKIAALKRENQQLGTKVEIIRGTLAHLRQSVGSVPKTEQILADIKRKTELEYAMFSELKRQLFTMDIQEITLRNQIRVLDGATLAGISPPLRLLPRLVIAVTFALILGAMAAIVIDELGFGVKTRREIEANRFVLLASIPDVRLTMADTLDRTSGLLRQLSIEKARKTLKSGKLHRVLRRLVHGAGHTKIALNFVGKNLPAESRAFDYLRKRVTGLKAASGSPAKAIALTSPGPGAGTSFVTLNLGTCMAGSGAKVLLVDCDFAGGTLSAWFDASEKPGLAQLLANTDSPAPIPSGTERLHILPSGGVLHDSSNLLGSDRLAEILGTLAPAYDYILMDTSSLAQSIDPILIAKSADQLLMVVGQHATKRDHLILAAHRIRELSETGIPCVFNKVSTREEYLHSLMQEFQEPGKKRERSRLSAVPKAG